MSTYDTRQSRIGRPLNDDERSLLTDWSRWGSDGYPVRKLQRSRTWTWDYRSLGAPVVYKTKREAWAAFEAFIDVLIDASGEEARDRALAEQGGTPMSAPEQTVSAALALVRRIRACEGEAAGVALIATFLRQHPMRAWMLANPCRCPRTAYGYPIGCQCGYDEALR